LREEWQKPDGLDGDKIERYYILRKLPIVNKNRKREDLIKFRMLRVESRSLGISPEDCDMSKQDNRIPNNQLFLERLQNYDADKILGKSWRDMYDPELGEGTWSRELKEAVIISHMFKKRPTYRRKPTFAHRVLVTARNLLRAGVENEQYQPSIELYKEF
jgi:hypothetical protein